MTGRPRLSVGAAERPNPHADEDDGHVRNGVRGRADAMEGAALCATPSINLISDGQNPARR